LPHDRPWLQVGNFDNSGIIPVLALPIPIARRVPAQTGELNNPHTRVAGWSQCGHGVYNAVSRAADPQELLRRRKRPPSVSVYATRLSPTLVVFLDVEGYSPFARDQLAATIAASRQLTSRLVGKWRVGHHCAVSVNIRLRASALRSLRSLLECTLPIMSIKIPGLASCCMTHWTVFAAHPPTLAHESAIRMTFSHLVERSRDTSGVLIVHWVHQCTESGSILDSMLQAAVKTARQAPPLSATDSPQPPPLTATKKHSCRKLQCVEGSGSLYFPCSRSCRYGRERLRLPLPGRIRASS